MENEVYWIWLQQCLGYAKKLGKTFKNFTDAKEIYEAENDDRRVTFGNLVAIKMAETDLSEAKETFDFCKEHKIHVITPQSEFYPKNLLAIEDYPLVLYVRGDYKCLKSELIIAVIGSRSASQYGEKVTEYLVSGLAQNNVLVVSGGAVGIDSVAHEAAINNSGKTVLVMGCGHGYNYLPENSELRKRVAQNGALISEYPPFFPVDQGSFPKRNRIISGMSDGVIVTEASKFSGTFSTVNHAIRQNKKIFSLPGDIISKKFEGSNKLIVDGAIPVFSGEGILREYGFTDVKKVKGFKDEVTFKEIDEEGSNSERSKRSHARGVSAKNKSPSEPHKTEIISENPKNIPEGISKNAQIVYNVMSEGVCELDEIIRNAQLEVRFVLSALTELELFGVISTDGPNKYRIN